MLNDLPDGLALFIFPLAQDKIDLLATTKIITDTDPQTSVFVAAQYLVDVFEAIMPAGTAFATQAHRTQINVEVVNNYE